MRSRKSGRVGGQGKVKGKETGGRWHRRLGKRRGACVVRKTRKHVSQGRCTGGERKNRQTVCGWVVNSELSRVYSEGGPPKRLYLNCGEGGDIGVSGQEFVVIWDKRRKEGGGRTWGSSVPVSRDQVVDCGSPSSYLHTRHLLKVPSRPPLLQLKSTLLPPSILVGNSSTTHTWKLDLQLLEYLSTPSTRGPSVRSLDIPLNNRQVPLYG